MEPKSVHGYGWLCTDLMGVCGSHGCPQILMGVCGPDGCPWIWMGISGSRMASTAPDGRLQLWMGTPRSGRVSMAPMGAHGSSWASTDPNGHPRLQMDARHEPPFQKDQNLTTFRIKRENPSWGFTAHPTDPGEAARIRSGDKVLQQTFPTDKTHPGAATGEWRQLQGASPISVSRFLIRIKALMERNPPSAGVGWEERRKAAA